MVAYLSGTLSVFVVVAYQAYLPALVGREHLVDANGKMNASASLAQLAGPSAAGVLVQLFTAPMPVVVDALSFLGSVVGLSLIRRPEPALAPRRRDMRAEIREGLAALLGHPVLRAIVISASMFVLLFSAQLAIFLLYLSRDLHLEPFAIGLLLAIGSVGALVGALSASTITRRIGIGPTFVFGAVLASMWFLGRGLIAEPQGVAVVSVAVAQLIGLIGFSILNVSSPSLRQALTPAHLLGRVNASYRFLVWGTGPFGALIGGTLGELFGLRTALLITGIAIARDPPDPVRLAGPTDA